MAGRGGRGAIIKQLLEKSKKKEEAQRPGGASTAELAHIPSPAQPTHVPSLVQAVQSCPAQPPAPRGRGAFILKMAAAAEKKISSVGDIPYPATYKLKEEDKGHRVHELRTTLYNAPPTEPPTEQMGKMVIAKTPRPPPQLVTFKGESGTPCQVMVNYLELTFSDNGGIFEYEVQFNPPVDARGFRSRLVRSLVDDIGEYKTFDGTTLSLPHRLPVDILKRSVKSHEGTDIEVSVIFKRHRAFHENIHFYNSLFREIAFILNLVLFKDCLFDPKGKMAIPERKLEVWPGYVTAIDEYEGGLKLQIDSSSRVLRTNTCLDLIDECREKFGGNYREVINVQLVGQVVLTRYNNKTYRIDAINFDENPTSTFEKHGEQKSFVDYYREQYKISIRDMTQPLLMSKVKRKTRHEGVLKETEYFAAIVPELAFLTGLSEEMRNDFNCMKRVNECTRVTPNQKLMCIRKYVDNVLGTPKSKALLEGWGLSLGRMLEKLNGRVFPHEEIYFGNNVICNGTPSANWNRDVGRNSALTVVDFRNWLLVHINRNKNIAQGFVTCLKSLSRSLGIRIAEPHIVSMQEESSAAYVNALKKAVQSDTQFVVVIFNAARTDRYQDVKRFCCCERPLPSQVINARTISREDKMKSIVMKIALQINCKLGGSLWSVDIPFKASMIVGIDVYHESVGSTGYNVVGLVSSLNANYTSYFSRAIIQERGQEITLCITESFFKALIKYIELNNVPPKQIFIYRDGVSDGQLESVTTFEIEQYQITLDRFMQKWQDRGNSCAHYPKLTVVIVQKRINTKIFAVMGSDANPHLDNPAPGTVVDYSVTRKSLRDFFLVSQHVQQGTVTPTHYIVLKDDNSLKVDHIQRLSYKLCHLYYNWPGTVRVPSICQYAHRIAYLTGMHLKKLPSESLSDKLFYL